MAGARGLPRPTLSPAWRFSPPASSSGTPDGMQRVALSSSQPGHVVARDAGREPCRRALDRWLGAPLRPSRAVRKPRPRLSRPVASDPGSTAWSSARPTPTASCPDRAERRADPRTRRDGRCRGALGLRSLATGAARPAALATAARPWSGGRSRSTGRASPARRSFRRDAAAGLRGHLAGRGDCLTAGRSSPSPARALSRIWLSSSQLPRLGTVRKALALALGDPSLEVGYWVGTPTSAGTVEPLTLPAAGAGRAVTLVEREEVPVAVLIHDAALADDPTLSEAVAAAARLAAANARLQAELRARCRSSSTRDGGSSWRATSSEAVSSDVSIVHRRCT